MTFGEVSSEEESLQLFAFNSIPSLSPLLLDSKLIPLLLVELELFMSLNDPPRYNTKTMATIIKNTAHPIIMPIIVVKGIAIGGGGSGAKVVWFVPFCVPPNSNGFHVSADRPLTFGKDFGWDNLQ